MLMLQKLFSWILFLSMLLINLGLTWWFWIGYNLFTPHSNIVYTGWAYWSWKLLLGQSLLAITVLFVHLFLGGQALWRGDTLKARKISLMVIFILSLQLILSFV